MKKILFLFSAFALVITSCTSEDSAGSSIKPKTITHLYSDADDNYITDVVYNGNKLVSETDDDGFTIKYTYSGDVITKSEDFNGDNELQSTTEFTYVNGKLDTEIQKNPGATQYYKIKYSHNADGTISFEGGYINSVTGIAEGQADRIGKYTYINGNMVKYENSYKGSGISTYNYEYDNKNSPSKNVLGVNLLIGWQVNSSANNVVKITSPNSDFIATYSYSYNGDDFPTEQKQFGGGNLNKTVQYAY